MNFAPSRLDRVLHDTWMFLRDDEIHLFYLAPQVGENAHRLIGHALSTNWLDWEELPFIELTGAAGEWDSGRIGTGHVFQYDDGRYYMPYTGRIDPQEDIGLAVSDDLIHWEKVLDHPVWPQAVDLPYERAVGIAPAWRDPFVVRNPQGEWEAYLCARCGTGPLAGRACVARCRIDGIDRWTTLDPVAVTGHYAMMEVPELFELDGRYWLTFNSGSAWGRQLDTTRRPCAGGTFYLVADEWDGPWRIPDDNVLIGSADGRRDAVVARSVEFGGKRVVYHHYNGTLDANSHRAMGLPKVLASDGDRLYVKAWSGLEELWLRPLLLDDWQAPEDGPLSSGQWQVTSGRIHGRCERGGAACIATAVARDIDVELTVTIEQGARAGIAVGLDDHHGTGLLVLLDALRDRVTIGWFAKGGGAGPYLDETMDTLYQLTETGRDYHLRLIARDRYAELYLDGELVFSTITGRASAGGGIACVVDEAEAQFSWKRAHEIKPMART